MLAILLCGIASSARSLEEDIWDDGMVDLFPIGLDVSLCDKLLAPVTNVDVVHFDDCLGF